MICEWLFEDASHGTSTGETGQNGETGEIGGAFTNFTNLTCFTNFTSFRGVGSPQRRVFHRELDEKAQARERGKRLEERAKRNEERMRIVHFTFLLPHLAFLLLAPFLYACQQARLTQTQHHTIIRGPAQGRSP